jgi:formylglycine-generating enzyme required for sulfatase activity
MRWFSTLILGVTMWSLTNAAAFADTRVALVIGNGAYAHAPHLPNPTHDAEDVAAALKRTGFDTILGTDLDQIGMQNAAIRFARAARTADVAVFYYSGHAMQYAGVNYLVPVDAELRDEPDLRRMARVDEILADLQQAKNLRILVLDSCRDNPLADELKRSIGVTRSASIGRGLAKMESPDGTIISYSTQAGRTAEDGSDRNSPYTTAFLQHIADKEDISTVFHRIGASVYQITQGKQVPELSLSFFGEFYLNGKVQVTVTPNAPTTPSTPADPCSAAESHWKSSEAIGTVAAFEDHLAHFPNCAFAGLARERLESLKSKVAIVAPPNPPPVASASCNGEAVTVSRSAQPLSVTEECALRPKDVFRECVNCPEMVVVPAGSFTMGSPESEKDRNSNEGPQHNVTIARPLAVGKFHVTLEQYAGFVDETGHDAESKCVLFVNGKLEYRQGYSWRNSGFAQGRLHPAVCVNWNDAKAYVAWLAHKTGKAYRLLTEAEWEYAARARTEPGVYPRYSFGNDARDMCRYANGTDQTAKNSIGGITWPVLPCNDGYAYTSPVGSFEANGFGLYDMQGNSWQWTEDCYHDSYYGAPKDGSAWTSGDCSHHILRGGDWLIFPKDLRVAFRFSIPSDVRGSAGSLRVARTLGF